MQRGSAVAPDKPDEARLRPAVVAVAAAAGLSSGAALVIAILTSRPLWATSVFIVVPGLVAFVALSVTVRRDEQQLFLTRLRVGLLAGLLATIAYDVSRWAVEVTNLTQTNSFVAIRAFGFGLTGRPRNDGIAMAAGWAFHYVNGVGFAVAYLFVAARRRWWWAIGYALVLESFLVTLYPGWLNLQLSSEFLSVSIGGHVAYGTVLGLMARRTP